MQQWAVDADRAAALRPRREPNRGGTQRGQVSLLPRAAQTQNVDHDLLLATAKLALTTARHQRALSGQMTRTYSIPDASRHGQAFATMARIECAWSEKSLVLAWGQILLLVTSQPPGLPADAVRVLMAHI